MPILIRGARVVTPPTDPARWPLRGPGQGGLTVLPDTDVLCDGVSIAAVGPGLAPPPGCTVVEAGGRVLSPGLIDCHTHACWAGDRLDEWERKLRGATYLEVLRAGGGILSTVRAVRAADQAGLAAGLLGRLGAMLRAGTTTAEVKSGYGLTTEHEVKMLRAIRDAAGRWPGTLVATALLGHAKDPDRPGLVEEVVRGTLPAVHAEFPGVAVDAFCESGAWTLAECLELFRAAAALGHPVRVHADQFTPMGMVPAAAGPGGLDAVSVDHLEATTPGDAAVLAASGAVGVGLPVCGLHVDGRYADLRRLVGLGGAVAVATNLNPGSAPCVSMAVAMGVAVRQCGLTPAEAWVACTANPAAVLGLRDRGAVGAGLRADLVLWGCRDEREVPYWVGGPGVDAVICGGARVI